MPQTWVNALNLYNYPVNLGNYVNAANFRGFFNLNIVGDRNSTIAFENHFRERAGIHTEVYYELTFWKMFSQGGRANIRTDEVSHRINQQHILDIFTNAQEFVHCVATNDIENARHRMSSLLAFYQYERSRVIANVATANSDPIRHLIPIDSATPFRFKAPP